MYPQYPFIGVKIECSEVPIQFPPEEQDRQPGLEYIMEPRPISENPDYKGSGKLSGKIAVITGGDSGIGRAVSYAFAKEGANLAIAYLDEHRDAYETKNRVEELGRECILIPGDLREEKHCREVIEKAVEAFGRIDILVNNHGVVFPQDSILDITEAQLDDTFRTNIYPFFYLTKAALPHMKPNSAIINTSSVAAYMGEKTLIDYTATKSAIIGFTKSLSLSLELQHIRVNAVAPGTIWTPLIPAAFRAEYFMTYGSDFPMQRAGQPFEVAPAYVYLACDDSRYVSGQVINVNGGLTAGT